MKQLGAGVIQILEARVWNNTLSQTGLFVCPRTSSFIYPFLFFPQFSFFFFLRKTIPSSYSTNESLREQCPVLRKAEE